MNESEDDEPGDKESGEAGPEASDQKDKGWSWMVALGSFIVLFIVIAYIRNAGIFFIAIKARTGASTQDVAWVSTCFMICSQLLTPVGCMLAVRFGTRSVVMLGGVLMSISLALSVLSNNLIFYIITLGVMEGIGAAFCLIPSVIILGFHFERRIGLANSLAFAGSSIGHMILAPSLTYLMDYYGLEGALLIMCGLTLHIVVAGALMRQGPETIPRARPRKVDSPSQLEVYQSQTSVMSEEARRKTESQWTVFRKLINRPTFFALCVSSCSASFVFSTVFKYIPPYGEDLLVGDDTIALMFAIGGGADLAARLITGLFMDTLFVRTYVKRYRITGTAVLLMAVNAFVLSGNENHLLFCVCMIVHTAASGILYSSSSVTALDLLGKDLFPLGHSLGAMSGILMAPLDSMALGKLRDMTGNFTATFCFIGAVALLGALALFGQHFLQDAQCSGRSRTSENVLVNEPLRTSSGRDE